MTVPGKSTRIDAAPALFRLLADSALARAALNCCGMPVAIIDVSTGKAKAIKYSNVAFEALFGYCETDMAGRSLAALLFRGDEPLVQRLLEGPRRWALVAWGKDGTERHVELAVAGVRGVDGRVTHWVLSFTDRSEVEKLRGEIESLKALSAASLGMRLDRQQALVRPEVQDVELKTAR